MIPRYDWPSRDRAAGSIEPMSTDQVANRQWDLTAFARSRIHGTGQDQYVVNGLQKFQSKTDEELVQDIREELADAINYLSFLYINLEDRFGVRL